MKAAANASPSGGIIGLGAHSGGGEAMKAQRPSTSIIIPTLISICSLFVACLSLWFSIDAQRSDREYKEISIRPSLSFDVSDEYYSVLIKNSGLGPALIKRVGHKFTNSCVEFNEADPDSWERSILTTMQQHFAPYFIEGLLKAMRQFGFEYPEPFKARMHLPSPGTMISTGAEATFFRIEPVEAEKLRSRLRERGLLWQIQEKFAYLARETPIFMEYCSATGKFCTMSSRYKRLCSA
jgi:hypothetical protein